MARIRTIKPDFFRNEEVAGLTYRARLTWVGLWTYADDEGRGKDNARIIKGDLWPLEDDVTHLEVEADLKELEQHGRITRYEVNGERFLFVNKWRDHQRIAKPTASKLPPPPLPNLSGRTTTPLPEDYHTTTEPLPLGKEVEVEREMEVEEEVKPARKRATRIPEDFAPSPEMLAWAATNTPNVNPSLATQKFINYWTAKSSSATKLDWPATWRNWMLSDQERAPANRLTGSQARLQQGLSLIEETRQQMQAQQLELGA